MKKGDIWFMSYPVKEIWRNILSVVAGVLSAIVITVALTLLTIFLNLGVIGDASVSRAEENIYHIMAALAIAIGTGFGGYITAKISTRKHIIHITITGAILVFIKLFFDKFDFSLYDIFETIFLLLILPSVLIGGLVGIKSKKSVKDYSSSLPDNPLQ